MNEVLRQEKKYLLSLEAAGRLAGQFSRVIARDSHNGSGGYSVRSLYFDSIEDGDYQDKVDGLEIRRKIRLRCYDPGDSFAVLEMKQKEGAYQRKRSLRLPRADAIGLTAGDYRVLLRYNEPFALECYGLMTALPYRPKAIVEYRRRAFVAKENNLRITFDSQITATEASFDLFSPGLLQYPVLDPFHVILEVKYNGFLLSYIKNTINCADRSELSISKYCLARSVGLHDSS